MSQTKAQVVDGFNINTSVPADSFVIDSSGKIGLGTSSPSHLLTLNAPNANAMTLFVGDTTDRYSSIRGKYGAGNDSAQSEIRFINADTEKRIGIIKKDTEKPHDSRS